VLLSTPGRSILTLDNVIPLAASAGADIDRASAVAIADLISRQTALAKSGVDLSVTAASSRTMRKPPATAAGRVRRPNQALAMTEAESGRPARRTTAARPGAGDTCRLGEDACQVAAAVRVEVLQGLARCLLTIPPDSLSTSEPANRCRLGHERRAPPSNWLESDGNEVSFVVSGDPRTRAMG